MTPQEIISDADVVRVHGSANFGGMSPREVIDKDLLKYAFGYSSGATALSILVEHGLVKKPRLMSYHTTPTAKGRAYLRAVYGPRFKEIVSMRQPGQPAATPKED